MKTATYEVWTIWCDGYESKTTVLAGSPQQAYDWVTQGESVAATVRNIRTNEEWFFGV